jgi:hypothetical protein
MDCKQIQKMLVAFDNNELSTKEEELFVSHLENCDDCKEEFEIHYIVAYGLEEEDAVWLPDRQSLEYINRYDFKGLVELRLKNSRQKLEKRYAWGRLLSLCIGTSDVCLLLAAVVFIIIKFF